MRSFFMSLPVIDVPATWLCRQNCPSCSRQTPVFDKASAPDLRDEREDRDCDHGLFQRSDEASACPHRSRPAQERFRTATDTILRRISALQFLERPPIDG